MKKLILLLTIFLNLTLLSLAQKSYNNLIKEIIPISDSTFQLIEKDKNDTIVTGMLTAINPEVRNGEFKFFDKNGRILVKGIYQDNTPSGIWYFYNKKGEILREIDYNKAIEFIKSDTIKYKGKIFFTVEHMPKFRGGDLDKFKLYVQKNLEYPIYSKIRGNVGNPTVQFTVDEKGKVGGVSIQRSAGDIDLNMEVLRIISESPNWEPGKQRNNPVHVRFVIPVVFQL